MKPDLFLHDLRVAIRLALGAHPRKILTNVLIEGVVIAVIGVEAGAV